MPYQSFDGTPADSDSFGKLAALKLPSLAGKSFLDLGCNEGFFCGVALSNGARRVVGIDTNADWVESARRRFPAAEFRCTSWWDLPDERFDVILLASALHYEARPRELLRSIGSHLAPGGVFVLECGVVPDGLDYAWNEVQRWDCAPKYPTLKLLLHVLLEDFAVRELGRSVDPPGDPIPRFVFHCQPYQPVVLLVQGPSGSGKTVLSVEFGKKGIPIIDLDQIVAAIASNRTKHTNEVCTYIRANYHRELVGFLYGQVAASAQYSQQLAAHVVGCVPPEGRMTVVEGALLENSGFRDIVQSLLAERGFKIWTVATDAVSTTRRDTQASTSGPQGYDGHVDALFLVGQSGDTEVLAGWCVKSDWPGPFGVIVEIDGIRQGLFMADRLRLDLKAAGIGNGAHGFEIALAGMPHSDGSTLRVLSADGAFVLNGSGCTLGQLKARTAQLSAGR